MEDTYRLIGFIAVAIGIIFGTLAQSWVKTRLLLFRDTSMVKQYIISIIFIMIGIYFFYISGSFN
ncbi:hypothetical protein BW731_03175 [Vagococcus martis]|uniref:Uncharacterized protein n=1 Tax=Vagococcus martis TaxID=1768210 RepID=A0A1V4DGE3_9ENTE|nr:hypothetical protein [Vagococcus martis]OPF87280.1 hypothetical protein BW731_03175 [Vagococcus martis]